MLIEERENRIGFSDSVDCGLWIVDCEFAVILI